MRRSYKKAFYILSLLCSVTIVFFKLFFSSHWSVQDELHGIALTHMLYKGDSLLGDIWNQAQLSGILILPFSWLYLTINTSTEGIALFLRITYFLMKTVLMLFCLSRLKKISKYGMLSFCAVLIVYVYTPFNIDTFSYNTIPLMGLLYIITILNSNRQSIIEAFLCGIVISFVVLSQPFCALIYLFLIIYFGGVLS